MPRLSLFAAVVFTSAGCNCSTLVPTAIEVVSGSGQAGFTGARLSQLAVVKVSTSTGHGVSHVAVTFKASAGGSVGSATVVTDANGNAETAWTLGPTVGAQTLTATAVGVTGSAVFSATATAAPATKLEVTTQPGPATLGLPLSTVVITAGDGDGSTITSFTDAVTLTLGVNPVGATLGGIRTVNAVAGVATFAGLTVDKAGSGFTLVASSPSAANVTTAPFDVVPPATATQLAFTTQPATGPVAKTLNPSPKVTVRDAQGNAVPAFTGAVTVAFAANPAGAALGGTTTVNAVSGVATFSTLTVDKVSGMIQSIHIA